MKVLMLNYEYPPLGGGQGNANKYIFDEFNTQHAGIRIDIITSSVDKEYTEQFEIGTIRYLNIGKKNQNIQSQNMRDLFISSHKTFWAALGAMKKTKYDVVVAWSGIPAGFIAMFLKFFKRIPYIVLLRGTDVPFHEKKWEKLDKLIFSWLSPMIWRRAAKVIANSKMLRDLAYRSGKSKTIDVITNGIDVSFFKPLPLQDNPKQKIVLGVGRLALIKGYHLLIDAIAKIQNPDIVAWLVGDGIERENLKKQARELGVADRVFFLGIKTKKELLKIYNQSQIFCLPSFNEGMSNALLEAIACGLPVIATDVGGVAELIDSNGVVIEKNNSSELAKAIEWILNDKQRYELMRQTSVATAQQYSWQKVTDKFLAAFQNISKQ